ncbi:NAD-binding Rossmann fold oxidoreductase family protein [Penicillium angulare]|uniref:NAD-binding Rossmann fold oxidoreductase family protein n=1 Tax=Penicillium angulare TaxID=116970 RepID=A0A9W9GBQ5_9EURO|nr:NAD-binding Rossmann fold oxidoreductase family protein [Penicillium angulare]
MSLQGQRKLQIGIVGLGRMGQRHALNILYRTPHANLLCVCSPAPADREWAKKNLPSEINFLTSFEEMIETPGLEAVIIASATPVHASQSLEALNRGIHVLCEKPVTLDVTELQNLITESKRNTTAKIMVGFTRRFDASYKDARKKVLDGKIGEPVVIRSHGCEACQDGSFFVEYARQSGGIFVDTTIHDIDLALSFFGEDVQPRKLWATGVIAKYPELEKFGDYDNAVGIVEFWGGKIAYFYNNRIAVHGYDNTTEIVGTGGKLSINANSRQNRVEVTDGSGHWNDITPSWIDRYEEAFVTEVNEFTEAIIQGNDLPLSFASALTSLKIGLALQESLQTGESVSFDEQGNRISK